MPYASNFAFTAVLQAGDRRYSSFLDIPLSSAVISDNEALTCTPPGDISGGFVYWACSGITSTLIRNSGSVPDLVALTEAVP